MTVARTVELIVFRARRFFMMTTRPIGQISSRPHVVRVLAGMCAFVLAWRLGAGVKASAADGQSSPILQGFSTDLSVSRGQTVHFKIATDASAYSIAIY